MGWGIDMVMLTAATVAAWPGAVVQVPPMPDLGLALIVLGGLWLCLWQRAWRWAGLLPILAGALSPLTFQPPDLLVSGDRSEEHTSELQSLMRLSYAVFCLKKKNNDTTHTLII